MFDFHEQKPSLFVKWLGVMKRNYKRSSSLKEYVLKIRCQLILMFLSPQTNKRPFIYMHQEHNILPRYIIISEKNSNRTELNAHHSHARFALNKNAIVRT